MIRRRKSKRGIEREREREKKERSVIKCFNARKKRDKERIERHKLHVNILKRYLVHLDTFTCGSKKEFVLSLMSYSRLYFLLSIHYFYTNIMQKQIVYKTNKNF